MFANVRGQGGGRGGGRECGKKGRERERESVSSGVRQAANSRNVHYMYL